MGSGFDGRNVRSFTVGNRIIKKTIEIKYYRKISGLRFDIGSTSGNEIVIEEFFMKTADMKDPISLLVERSFGIWNGFQLFLILTEFGTTWLQLTLVKGT